jgi:hypothetical protein
MLDRSTNLVSIAKRFSRERTSLFFRSAFNRGGYSSLAAVEKERWRTFLNWPSPVSPPPYCSRFRICLSGGPGPPSEPGVLGGGFSRGLGFPAKIADSIL